MLMKELSSTFPADDMGRVNNRMYDTVQLLRQSYGRTAIYTAAILRDAISTLQDAQKIADMAADLERDRNANTNGCKPQVVETPVPVEEHGTYTRTGDKLILTPAPRTPEVTKEQDMWLSNE